MARFKSLGESAFVNLARAQLLNTLSVDMWDVGGRDQLVARFKAAVTTGDRILGSDAQFQVSVFVNRPERDGARCSLAVRFDPPSGMTKDESCKIRDAVAGDLRQALSQSPIGKYAAKNSTVASIRVRVDAAEGDTAGAAEAALPLLQEVLKSVRAVEPVLASWSAERLPALLARHGSGREPPPEAKGFA